jgi:hypothetical protein
VPADLDLKPYRDEHDFDLLRRMQAAIGKGKPLAGINPARIARALARHAPELKHRLDQMTRREGER